MESKILYKETFAPWFKPLVIFLPTFYNYGIIIQQEFSFQPPACQPAIQEQEHEQEQNDQQEEFIIENQKDENISITFGYGRNGPVARYTPSGGFVAQTVFLRDIDPSSIVTGIASATDNLLNFGGWGIRYNFKTKTWAYNAINGPFIEFVQQAKDSEKRIKYRIVSHHVDEVVAFLSGNFERNKSCIQHFE
jgi:hypothetical protein